MGCGRDSSRTLTTSGTRCRRRRPSPRTRCTWRGPSGPCRSPCRRGSRRPSRSRAAAASPRGSGSARPFFFRSACCHVVAAAVAVGEPVERRHAAPGPAALDGDDDAGAAEPRRPQVRAVRHLRVHLAAVGRPAVARLAVRLLPVDPHAFRDILRVRGRRLALPAAGRRRAAPEQNCHRRDHWPSAASVSPGVLRRSSCLLSPSRRARSRRRTHPVPASGQRGGSAKLRIRSPPRRPRSPPPTPPSRTAPVHHVDGRRREHAGSGVELPQQLAGLRVEREEVPGDVAAGADEDEAAGRHDRAGLAEALEDLPPLQLARRRIVGREVALRPAPAVVERLIDRRRRRAARSADCTRAGCSWCRRRCLARGSDSGASG